MKRFLAVMALMIFVCTITKAQTYSGNTIIQLDPTRPPDTGEAQKYGAAAIREIKRALLNSTIGTNSANSGNVLNYGAIGNGANDDTVAIQTALYSNSVVVFPPLNYALSASLIIPPGRSLIGYSTPATPYNYPVQNSLPLLGAGSVFLITNTAQPAFIYNSGDRFQGLSFLYPNQTANLTTPIVYPPTFSMTNNGASVVDFGWDSCNFINPYIGIVATNAHGPGEFKNLTFWTPYLGIWIDNGGDSDFIFNTRFSSGYFANQTNSLVVYGSTNSTGILVGRADGFRAQNLFFYLMNIGLKTTTNAGNYVFGSIVDMETDSCQYGWWCEGATVMASNWRGNDSLYDFYVPPNVTYNNTRVTVSNLAMDPGTQIYDIWIRSQMNLTLHGGEIQSETNAAGLAAIRVDALSSVLHCDNIFFSGTSLPITNTSQFATLILIGNDFNRTNTIANSPSTFRYSGNTHLADGTGGP
jgi:hypothetical protein